MTAPYGWSTTNFVFGRRLGYRWRIGAWCEHPTRTGELVDCGMRKLWRCDTCGHATFHPGRRR